MSKENDWESFSIKRFFDEGGVTKYEIYLEDAILTSKRFNEFDNLAKEMDGLEIKYNKTEFPGTMGSWFGASEKLKEERRVKFDKFLKEVVHDVMLRDTSKSLKARDSLTKFLDLKTDLLTFLLNFRETKVRLQREEAERIRLKLYEEEKLKALEVNDGLLFKLYVPSKPPKIPDFPIIRANRV